MKNSKIYFYAIALGCGMGVYYYLGEQQPNELKVQNWHSMGYYIAMRHEKIASEQ